MSFHHTNFHHYSTKKNTYNFLWKEFTNVFNTAAIISLLYKLPESIQFSKHYCFPSNVLVQTENNHKLLKQSPFRGHVSDISVRKFRRHFRLVDVPLEILRNVSFHVTMIDNKLLRKIDKEKRKLYVTNSVIFWIKL